MALPGMSLIEVIDPINLTLTGFVPVAQVTQVSIGEEVEITVDSYPERTFSGDVIRIADQAQFTPSNVQTTEERVKIVFAVEIRVNDPEGLLHGGMPADVNFMP
jgi:HlyD family secretion protein